MQLEVTRVSIIPNRFTGKRAVVTGASKGIGRATALRLAAEGGRVGLVSRSRDGLDAVADEIRRAKGDCLVLPADCSIEDEICRAVDRAADEWGGLDVLVSNAGIELPEEETRVDAMDLDVWTRLITTNLTGQFLTSKHGARRMLESGGGAIVCIGSNLGFFGMGAREPGYSASKGGVFAMMRVMANDYAKLNIRVNMVVPGIIETPMNDYLVADPSSLAMWLEPVPIGRMGSADECAAAILWLASDEASYCVGAALVVDGGMAAI